MEFIKLNIQLFAGNISDKLKITSTKGNYGYLQASLEEVANSVNATTNKNKVKVKATLTQKTGSWAQMYTPLLEIWWYDNNKNKSGIKVSTTEVSKLSSGDVKTAEGIIEVEHLSDGSLKGYAKAKWLQKVNNSLIYEDGEISTDNIPLTTIPRAKTITALSADIGYDTLITLKQTSEDYTVTITYECGELSGTIEEKTSETSIGWKIPNEIYTQLSSTDKEIDIKLTATTYDDDTQIGSTQTTFKARVNEEDNRPLAYLDVEDVNEITTALTGDPNKVVLNASSMKCNVRGMSKNGATIQSMKINGIELIDFSYQQPDEGTPEDITEIALDEFTINKPTTNVFTLIVTDSRGFTNTITSENQKTLEKIDYIIPTISATFKRNTPVDGLVNVRYDGKFFNGLFKEGTSNTLQMAYQYRDKESDSEDYSDWIALTPQISETDNTYGGQLQLEELFNYEKQFDFRLSVKDSINDYGVVFTTGSIAKGKPSHWYDDENFYVEGGYYQRNKETGKWFKPIGNLTDLETDDKGSVVKAINSVNERTTTNIMTIGLTANKNLPISTAWSYLQLLCDSVKTTIGDKLTFENNAIKIGAGVKYVRVSANAMLNGVTGDKVIMITKNSTIISQGYSRLATANHYGVISLTPITIPVTEGDLIMLKYGSSVTGTLVIAGGVYTYLTVEAIA